LERGVVLKRPAVQRNTIISVFRVEEQAKQETSKKLARRLFFQNAGPFPEFYGVLFVVAAVRNSNKK
jgi:hypothetical protein